MDFKILMVFGFYKDKDASLTIVNPQEVASDYAPLVKDFLNTKLKGSCSKLADNFISIQAVRLNEITLLITKSL